MVSRDGKYQTRSEMCSLKRERWFPGELAFLSSMDVEGSRALENLVWTAAMQPAMNVSWILLGNTPGPQHASSRVMLPKLHT